MSEYTSNSLSVPSSFTGASSSMSYMTIRATPEEMEAKAQVVLKEVAIMRREYEDMNRLVERTSGYALFPIDTQCGRRMFILPPRIQYSRLVHHGSGDSDYHLLPQRLG